MSTQHFFCGEFSPCCKRKGPVIPWKFIVKKFQNFHQISRKKPMKLPRNLADF
jgi:hypothetical protein